MPVFSIDNIEPLSVNRLFNESFIVILHTDRTPPHLAMIMDGKFYSLNVDGKQVGYSVINFLRNISIRKIQTLFVEIKQRGMPGVPLIEEVLQSYDKVSLGQTTCLTPLKDYFYSSHKINTSSANYIFELLPIISGEGATGNTYHLNMDQVLTGGRFDLKKYSMDDINRRIKHLSL
jgi:hypothetical protein